MNPIWAQMIYGAVKEAKRVSAHVKKASPYKKGREGRSCEFRYCGYRFKERGE